MCFSEKLIGLGFERQLDTLYSLKINNKLNATLRTWEVFAYFEDDKYYLSDNGDLVCEFDSPNVDIVFMLKLIKCEIVKFGCFLNDSKIVKEIDINNIEKELSEFISAVNQVDKMYNEV